MDDTDPGPAAQTDVPSENSGGASLTIDLTTSAAGGSTAAANAATAPAAPASAATGSAAAGSGNGNPPDLTVTSIEPRLLLKPYIPDKQRDYVRLIVTVGLLLMLGWVIVWSCIEAASWSDHWAQTKEMLQTILPALTGLIGSVIGFYFGSGVNSTSTSSSSGTSSTAANKIV